MDPTRGTYSSVRVLVSASSIPPDESVGRGAAARERSSCLSSLWLLWKSNCTSPRFRVPVFGRKGGV